MGIDELLDFIESKESKKAAQNGKKSKKKNGTSKKLNSVTKTEAANINLKPVYTEPNGGDPISHDDDHELESFKNRLIESSISAQTITKIKPNITTKWD